MAAAAVRASPRAPAAPDAPVPRTCDPALCRRSGAQSRAAARWGPRMNEAEIQAVGPVHRELDLTLGQRLAIGFGALLAVISLFSVAVYVWHTQSVAAPRG